MRRNRRHGIASDPSSIRSVNAAFDPARSGSANILAAHPFAGAMPTYQTDQPRNFLSGGIY